MLVPFSLGLVICNPLQASFSFLSSDVYPTINLETSSVFCISLSKNFVDENGEWRMLHNEELHSLYGSPNIVRGIKSRRLRWAEDVARMEEGRSASKF